MPDFAYDLDPWLMGFGIVSLVVVVSLVGLVLFRRFLAPRLKFDVDVNDAAGAAIQAIGVFYGITVGLLAVGVWTTHADLEDLVSTEAASLAALYRDVSAYPDPTRQELQTYLREYTQAIIDVDWPAQAQGTLTDDSTEILNRFQAVLSDFEPTTRGDEIIHAEALRQYNNVVTYRRERANSVGDGLAGSMWAVIWLGAVINLSVAYFLTVDDLRIHAALVGLIAAFIGLVIFVIAVNDDPFRGSLAIDAHDYQLVIDRGDAPYTMIHRWAVDANEWS